MSQHRETKSSSWTTTIITTAVLIMICIQGCSSIKCYQCATTNQNEQCVNDYWGFINDSMGLTDTYIKDCTAMNPNWTRCMIETLEKDGRMQHFHRGCHDGRTFSTQFSSPRFMNIRPTNETTCAHVIVLACYTFCDTDLCNGPQPPPNKTDQCKNYAPLDYDSVFYDAELEELCGGSGRLNNFSFVSLLLVSFLAVNGLLRLQYNMHNVL